jgi:archaellum component FlaC
MFPTKEDIKRVEEKVDKLQNDVSKLHNKLDNLDKLLQNDIAPSCSKMGNHIDFVECVYTNVKSPLGYLVDKVNYMVGGSSGQPNKALPDVKQNTNDVVPNK